MYVWGTPAVRSPKYYGRRTRGIANDPLNVMTGYWRKEALPLSLRST